MASGFLHLPQPISRHGHAWSLLFLLQVRLKEVRVLQRDAMGCDQQWDVETQWEVKGVRFARKPERGSCQVTRRGSRG